MTPFKVSTTSIAASSLYSTVLHETTASRETSIPENFKQVPKDDVSTDTRLHTSAIKIPDF